KGSNFLYTDAEGDLSVDLDADHNSRVFDSTIDIGAYEYHCRAIDLNQVTFADKEVDYDGSAKTIVAGNMPPGSAVRYEIIDENDQVITEAIEAGTYTIKAIFSGCGPDLEKTAQLQIKKINLVITPSDQTKTYGSIFSFDGTEFTANGLINDDEV